MRPRCCGVFRVEVREARTVHIVRRTLMGASAVGLATLLSAAAMTSFAAPAGAAVGAAQIPQSAAAQWPPVARRPQAARRQHRRLRSPHGATAIGVWPPRIDTAGARPALTYMEANADTYITKTGQRRSGPVGQSHSGRARHGRRSDQLRGHQPRGALLATEQTTGPDAGLFGTDAQMTLSSPAQSIKARLRRAQAAAGRRPIRGGPQMADGQQCTERWLDHAEPGHRRW